MLPWTTFGTKRKRHKFWVCCKTIGFLLLKLPLNDISSWLTSTMHVHICYIYRSYNRSDLDAMVYSNFSFHIYIYIEREREREHAHTKFIRIYKRQDSTTKGYNIQVSMTNHLCDFQNFVYLGLLQFFFVFWMSGLLQFSNSVVALLAFVIIYWRDWTMV